MEAPVCQACLEPLSNAPCPECVYRSVQRWIWSREPAIIEAFMGFHRAFAGGFSSGRTAVCPACGRRYSSMVCPCDYLGGVLEWLEDFVSAERLEDFVSEFRGVFAAAGRAGRLLIPRVIASPGRVRRIEGVCEACGNYSDDLEDNDEDVLDCGECR